jgi:hypothetical protein
VNGLAGITFDTTSLSSLWDNYSQSRQQISLCGALCWGIWSERNSLTFRDTTPKTVCSLIAHIYIMFLCWTSGRVSRTVALPDGLMQGPRSLPRRSRLIIIRVYVFLCFCYFLTFCLVGCSRVDCFVLRFFCYFEDLLGYASQIQGMRSILTNFKPLLFIWFQ